MQTQGPENIYARMPFIEKLVEMGWKKEPTDDVYRTRNRYQIPAE